MTRNISHFPQKILSEFDIEAQHPDDFILYQKDENLPAVIEQLRNCRMVLKKPPLSMDEFIEKFRKSDLQLTANWLAEIRSLFESSA